LSIAGGGIVASLVYGIKPTDIITYASVSIGVLLVAMMASWIPASRAARVDPTIAMRV
jgi:putative ABC transport system permease protein